MIQKKIHILHKERSWPHGWWNQFIKILKKEFINKWVYTDNIKKADIVIFNNFPFGNQKYFMDSYKIKKNYPQKVILHRIDWPIRNYRKLWKQLDNIIFEYSKSFADGTVFQSKWSQKESHKRWFIKKKFESVIINASDPKLFFPPTQKKQTKWKRNKIVISSRSANRKKWFDVYKYIDKNLDFKKYKVTFIGNSPIKFDNIEHIQALNSKKLWEELRNHDMYITASHSEACSNSLIEAIQTGLIPIGRNNTSMPEIIKDQGTLFEWTTDIIEKIEETVENFQKLKNRIKIQKISEIADQYYNFGLQIYEEMKTWNYKQAEWYLKNYIKIMYKFFIRKILSIWIKLVEKILKIIKQNTVVLYTWQK